MLPLEAAVTLAMNALCLAANSGLLSRDDLLPSDRGDSEPGLGVITPELELILTRKLRLELGSTASIALFLGG